MPPPPLSARSSLPHLPCRADSSRPFIVGDRIELRTLSGSVIVSGERGTVPGSRLLERRGEGGRRLAAGVPLHAPCAWRTGLPCRTLMSHLIALHCMHCMCLPGAGVVEAILPMRTTIRADNKLPISINNKARGGCRRGARCAPAPPQGLLPARPSPAQLIHPPCQPTPPHLSL